jgi:hypothetical protein
MRLKQGEDAWPDEAGCIAGQPTEEREFMIAVHSPSRLVAVLGGPLRTVALATPSASAQPAAARPGHDHAPVAPSGLRVGDQATTPTRSAPAATTFAAAPESRSR